MTAAELDEAAVWQWWCRQAAAQGQGNRQIQRRIGQDIRHRNGPSAFRVKGRALDAELLEINLALADRQLGRNPVDGRLHQLRHTQDQ